jgi:ATP-dependent Clp protease protease subunit
MPKRKFPFEGSHSSDEESDEEEGKDVVKRISNHIYFYSKVSTLSQLKVIELLKEIQHDFEKVKIPLDLMKIFIHLNSPGGDVMAGFALYDIFRMNPVPIIGIVEGTVASSATLLLLGCSRRKMNPNSRFLMHDISGSIDGCNNSIQNEAKNMSSLMKSMIKIYSRHSNLEKDEIYAILKKNQLLSSEAALGYSLIDEIVSPPEE